MASTGGKYGGVRDPEQERVLAAFLKAVEDYSGLEIGEKVPGISYKDISRWRNDDWAWFSAKKLRAMKRFLGMPVSPPLPLEPEPRDGRDGDSAAASNGS